ncbi:hypothetical protein UFOVP480_14 [uncultured Caudovirales phage]|uniref:Uncharacterized protein n=1 Tax=uncultured Caudovirales phage TaxID=2100421 RepID=A0A6J5MK90_9CAUD|nr:hypothetical protein UFOVP480_14 [uncultured Caudovirales phage]CAB4189697.1 hypothetical protein UFOVP1206_12 [uncultured Caudovirales phage]
MAKQTFTTGQVLTAAQMTSLQQTAMGGGSTTAKTTSYVLVAADAGTVVQMNAAGATTITVNTALFAAGDTVQIQNIGAGVCTVTAGTATVTTAGSLALSQWEGGQLYFTATGSAIFFDIVQSSGMTNPLTTTGDTIYSSSGTTPARLGIGSASQVLTVSGGIPAWATPTSGSLTLLSTTTLSTITTTISSISTAYKSLKLIIVDVKPVASGQEFFMRVNGDTGSNYTTVSTYGTTTAAGNVQTYGSTTSNVLTNGNFSMANTNNHTFIVDLVDYTNVDSVRVFNAQMYFENFTNAKTVQQQVMAYFTVGTAITSITLFLGGSTFSAGTAYLYGVN